MDMNIQKYIAFVKTVELGSFTKAAKILNYSQSGISRMIHDLEQEWGITLLERNRAGLRLTSDGMNVLPYAKELAEKYQTLQNQLAELGHLDTGLIRIGTFSSVATHWLPEAIETFQKDYPKIDFELLLGDYEEIEQWILEGRVDFGFSRLPASHNLEQRFLHDDEQLVVLPQGHPFLAKEKVHVTDLKAQPFILLEREGTSDVTELLAKAQVSPQIKLICSFFSSRSVIICCSFLLKMDLFPSFSSSLRSTTATSASLLSALALVFSLNRRYSPRSAFVYASRDGVAEPRTTEAFCICARFTATSRAW